MASEPAPSGRRRPRTRGKRVALAVLAGLATFAVLLVLDGIWAGRALVRGLTNARSELSVAIESIVTGDPGSAAPHFIAAARAADDARDAVGHPSMGIAGLLPIVGDNIDAAAAVADASRATADAGADMVRVARTLGWTDIRVPGSTAIGSVDIAAFEAAIPDMEAVARELRVALRALEAAGGDSLLGPVASGYRDAVEGLALRLDLATRFRDSLRLTTAMFAGDHRYLVCVPALGVPRPGGGAPQTAGVLVAHDGALEFESIAPAPPELIDADMSIDWPTTARALLQAAEASGLTDLDGVDPDRRGRAPRRRLGDRRRRGDRGSAGALGPEHDGLVGDRRVPRGLPSPDRTAARRPCLGDPPGVPRAASRGGIIRTRDGRRRAGPAPDDLPAGSSRAAADPQPRPRRPSEDHRRRHPPRSGLLERHEQRARRRPRTDDGAPVDPGSGRRIRCGRRGDPVRQQSGDGSALGAPRAAHRRASRSGRSQPTSRSSSP